MNPEEYVTTYIKNNNNCMDNYTNDIRRFNALSTKEKGRVMDKVKGVIKTYRYMITFTIDPKKVKDLKEDVVQEYIEKQLNRPALKITKAYLSKEGGDEDHKHIHWHAVVESLRTLKKNLFAY